MFINIQDLIRVSGSERLMLSLRGSEGQGLRVWVVVVVVVVAVSGAHPPRMSSFATEVETID